MIARSANPCAILAVSKISSTGIPDFSPNPFPIVHTSPARSCSGAISSHPNLFPTLKIASAVSDKNPKGLNPPRISNISTAVNAAMNGSKNLLT